MNHLKKYNEGLTDKMVAKDDEEVIKILSTLDALKKIEYIDRYKLPDKYYPSDEEISKDIKNIEPFEQLQFIRRYKLSDTFKPTDDEISKHLKTYLPLDQIRLIKQFDLSNDFYPSENEMREGSIKEVLELYKDDITKHARLTEMVKLLIENGYEYSGENIEDDNRERTEKTKGYDVVWFKYRKEPHHYLSFTNNSELSELKDRLNLYKKRYNL